MEEWLRVLVEENTFEISRNLELHLQKYRH